MSWHDFIFSNQSKQRTRRHLAFWFLWWTYVIFTHFVTHNPGNIKATIQPFIRHQPGLEDLGFASYTLLVLLKSLLLVLSHMLFCYTVITFLLPAFQRKINYWIPITGIVLVGSLMIPVGHFFYNIVYPFIDNIFDLRITRPDKHIFWRGVDASLLTALKVTLIAVAITLLKRWWLRQKEKEKLEKEKINAEVQLLKAQIHPNFLFSTLENITIEARQASSKAPEMLIKLSDLLSYMLYECDAPKVKLEREIMMLREYIALEKIRQGERLELTFQVNGELSDQWISPLMLLPFIDNSFAFCNNDLTEHVWVNLDITVESNNLSLKIINGIPAGSRENTSINNESMINIQKRLNLLYPGRHDLKINAEHELLMVHLNLKLEQPTQTEQNSKIPSSPIFTYA